MKKISLLLVLCVLAYSCSEKKAETTSTVYPATKKVDTVDQYFSTSVPDPYRWLENDTTAETAAWVKSENEVTSAYLNHIPYRGEVKARLEKLYNYQRFSAPFKAGGRYFFSKNDGLQNQSVLYMQKDLNSEPEVLLDPNSWSKDGTVALGGQTVSKDGKYLAFTIAESGSDWNKIIVMDLDKKSLTGDTVRRVKFSGTSWKGNGFYYSGFDKPKGSDLSGKNEFHKVFYHKLGDPQSKDQLVYKDPSEPLRTYSAQTTEDEKFLIVYGSDGTSGNNLLVKDLSKSGSPFITVVADFKEDHGVIEADGNDLLMMTKLNAPNQRVVRVNLSKPTSENWKEVVAESESRLQNANVIDGKLFLEYFKDATDRVYRHDLSGKREAEVDLPGIGTVNFGGNKSDKEIFYTFVSFTSPASIYRYNVAQNKSELFRKPEIDFKSEDYETKQVFYESKDGTKVPMFIVHKKGIKLDGTNPTWLYSYGGFDIPMTPGFSVSRLVWLENGGVYAQPSIRGGGEYGEKWHKGGMLLNKQNVFDDFIAAGEYLIKEKYTTSARLAISGGSNGGLLVGAVMTQRPDLMKVAVPAVGVMDMLRYEKFTIGWAWATEYGSVKDSVNFKNIYAYSPLHNIKPGVEYPATIVTTADHDDRVVPAHSFKFAATLQERQAGNNPVLIRIETKAGHGAGKPVAKIIEEQADIYSFVWYNMGVVPELARKNL